MPLRIMVTPGICCTHRSAHDAADASGRIARSSAVMLSGRFASLPPRMGSMTQMGTL